MRKIATYAMAITMGIFASYQSDGVGVTQALAFADSSCEDAHTMKNALWAKAWSVAKLTANVHGAKYDGVGDYDEIMKQRASFMSHNMLPYASETFNCTKHNPHHTMVKRNIELNPVRDIFIRESYRLGEWYYDAGRNKTDPKVIDQMNVVLAITNGIAGMLDDKGYSNLILELCDEYRGRFCEQ
jgi:hypothetical protein